MCILFLCKNMLSLICFVFSLFIFVSHHLFPITHGQSITSHGHLPTNNFSLSCLLLHSIVHFLISHHFSRPAVHHFKAHSNCNALFGFATHCFESQCIVCPEGILIELLHCIHFFNVNILMIDK